MILATICSYSKLSLRAWVILTALAPLRSMTGVPGHMNHAEGTSGLPLRNII